MQLNSANFGNNNFSQEQNPRDQNRRGLKSIDDELALRLNPLQEQLPQILELGLRQWNADVQSGFSGLAEVLEFLATLPTAEEILALKPSEALQQHIETLQEKNRTVGLTTEEERSWQQYEYVEHLVRVAKAKALLKLKAS